MSPRKLRVGIVGAGHLGTIHARLIRTIDDVHLVGVADPHPVARKRIEDELGVEVHSDHRALMGRIDAAILAAPTDHHYWIGMELAEAGIHLLVEKPLALNVAEAQAMIQATRSRRLVLQVGHVERFNPAFTTAAAQFTRPRFIDAVRASGYTGRSIDVGVVLDLMIHDIDLVLSLVSSPVVAVEAVGTPVVGPHEDLAHARLRFANGCLANLSASRVSYEAQRRMHVFAEEAFARIDFATAAIKIARPSSRLRRGEYDGNNLSSGELQQLRDNFFTDVLQLEEVQVERRNAILDEQHDFVISIRAGQTPQVTGEQARDALVIAQQVLDQLDAAKTIGHQHAPMQGPHWGKGPGESLRRAG